MQVRVNMHQVKTELSKLVQKAWEGHEIVIMRDNKAMARLVPFSEGRRVLGQARGQIWISPNFDDPLPDDLLDAFEGIGVEDMLGDPPDPQPTRTPDSSNASA